MTVATFPKQQTGNLVTYFRTLIQRRNLTFVNTLPPSLPRLTGDFVPGNVSSA
jgi:hypothetical protein